MVKRRWVRGLEPRRRADPGREGALGEWGLAAWTHAREGGGPLISDSFGFVEVAAL